MTDPSTWRIDPLNHFNVIDESDELVAQFYPMFGMDAHIVSRSKADADGIANAAFALRTIQAHDAMREALKSARMELKFYYERSVREFQGGLDIIDAVLALAEKP